MTLVLRVTNVMAGVACKCWNPRVSDAFTFHPDLGELVTMTPDGTLSRTVYQDDLVKGVLFAFDTGQELSEHSAGTPAIVMVLSGTATITVGEETLKAGPGSFLRMEARLKHSVRAETPLKLLLYLLKGSPAKAGA